MLRALSLKKGFTNIRAFDLSEEQIQIAKQKLEEYGLRYDKVQLCIGDAFEYLRTNNGFAMIALIDFLEHLQKNKIMRF